MPEVTVIVDGREWCMFDCQYDTPDGVFSFYIYAISFEHAAAMLADLKANARLIGEVKAIIPT